MFQLPRLPPRFDVALRDVRSERAEFRIEAAAALGRAEDAAQRAAARAALRSLLDDEVARVRAVALDSLGFVGESEDVPALCRMTRDARPALREAATIALARIDADDARIELRRLATSEHPEVRYQAVVGLGTQADYTAAGLVAERLTDEDVYVREAAAQALAALGPEAHRDALAKALGDVRAVALAAAHALAAANDRRAQGTLLAEVRRGRPSPETLAAVARLPDPATHDALAAIVARWLAPRSLRAECAAVLAASGDPRGLAHLRELLRARRDGPRIEALAYVARYGAVACAAEVAALVERPRGLPVDLLAHTLERLEAAPEARAALGRIDAMRTSP